MKKVFCISCGVVRMAEIDTVTSEKECKVTTKKVCPVCSCPYVKIIKEK